MVKPESLRDLLLRAIEEAVARTSRDLDASLALLELKVEYYPDATYSHFLVGEIYSRQEDAEAALASYERCLELDPDHCWAKERIASLQSAGSSD